MRQHPHIFLSLLLFFTIPSFSQDSGKITVYGSVVQMPEEKPLPDVKVRIVGFGWAFTDEAGQFSFGLPADKEYVQFELEGCPHPVVSPYKKLVHIPPSGNLDIKVCAKENKKLRDKIDQLNNRISSLERQRTLNRRQLTAMHQTMLDTILHFEKRIKKLESELSEKDEKLDNKNEQIESLEREVADLQEQLAVALEEKYLKQKAVFDDVSAALTQYIDQAKNLRDNMRPVQVKSYFSSAGARERLYESIEKYNAARQEVLDHHENHVVSVSNYWMAYELADELERVYNYLLKEVHDRGVYPMEFAVNDNLKQALTRQISSNKAKKAAVAGAEEAVPKLNPMIESLETQSEDIIQKLRTNL